MFIYKAWNCTQWTINVYIYPENPEQLNSTFGNISLVYYYNFGINIELVYLKTVDSELLCAVVDFLSGTTLFCLILKHTQLTIS